MNGHAELPDRGVVSRFWAMLTKEFIQLRRDRVTLVTMITVPMMQLLLFGYAINTTPHRLPAVAYLQESSDVGRSILAALKNSDFFEFRRVATSEADADYALESGEALFVIEIPANFERSLRRGETPALLVAADATDPVASGSALGALSGIVQSALTRDRFTPTQNDAPPPFEIREHRRYNPAGSSQMNIVPGLLGTLLTMTMLLYTSLSVTREIERGTMESLLAMPIGPIEIMLGKIAPYLLVGLIQALLIVAAGSFAFGVPIIGDASLLSLLTLLFIAANLAIGYTFSTIAQNQLQAMQMAIMFLMPNILLSGFAFPFSGMPIWARAIGECLPVTHYIRIVRGIMLKGSGYHEMRVDTVWLVGLMLVAMLIAVRRFRQTLD